MRKLIVLSGACLMACGALGGPALAKSNASATCDSKYYSYLVGKDISETQNLTADYRLVPAGASAAAAQPGRLTIVYDKGSQTILSVSCG